MAVIVGENISRLSALEGIDLEIYKSHVIDILMEAIIENRDRMS